MDHDPLAISPLLHVSKVSFNVPDPSFDRDPTAHETSSSLSSADEDLETVHGSQDREILKYLKGLDDGDVREMDSSDPKAAKLLSRLLKIESHVPGKSHLNRDNILLEYLSRNEEKKAVDGAKDEIPVEQPVPAEPDPIVLKDPDPEPEPKFEAKQVIPTVITPRRKFLPRKGPYKGPLADVYNALGLNEYEHEPEIQPTSDDTFLESIQSVARSPTTPDIAKTSPSRSKVATDVNPLKSSVENIAETMEGKFGWHGTVQKNKMTMPSSSTQAEKMKKMKDKVWDVVVAADAVGDDGPKQVGSKHVPEESQRHGQPDRPSKEKDDIDIFTLGHILGDIHPAMLKSIPGSNDAERNSTDAEDADSNNTRNEYWSVSSFRTKTQASDSDENDFSDWLVPPPADGQNDFTLPLDSLNKPIKKNTYRPVKQRTVEQFLEAATWRAEPTDEENETLWGAKKKLPLKPVEELSGSPVVPACAQPQFARHRDSHRDLFLQSIQAAERNDQQPPAGRERRRNRLERYPGTETVYSEFMREDAITGNRLSVKMISTQTTNSPERVLRFRSQGEAPPAVVTPPSPRPPPPSHKDCVICCEKVHLDEFSKSMHMLEHGICNGCVRNYLTTRIMKEATITIICPAENCAHLIDYNEIKAHAGLKVFSKYDELLSRKAYEEDPNFRWCTNRLCCAGQIVENGETSSHFTCIICKFKTCFQCRTPIHPQMTCMQNWTSVRKDYFAADAPSGIWLKSYTKPCYCGRWIQKMDGCDHVKCPTRPVGCGGEWCWMCGANYDEIRRIGNTAHRGDCPHYA